MNPTKTLKYERTDWLILYFQFNFACENDEHDYFFSFLNPNTTTLKQ